MFRRFLLEKCIELASEIKDFELHFSIGDTLVSCVLGPLSPAARDRWTVSEAEFRPLLADPEAWSCSADLDWFLDQLTGRLTQSDHPNVKQAGCLWLLSVVKHCIGQAGIQARLLHIQAGLWNRNYFLRFRFRLLTRYGSGSGSGSIGTYLDN
jgi:hypothetical protein